MFRRYPVGLVVAIVVGMGACGVAQAGQVPLSDLLQPGATITSGDKIFSDFTYSKTGDNPTPDAVNVIDIKDPAGNFGIRIQGGFLDRVGGSASDALITFKVSVPVGSDRVITDAHLSANPAVFDNGTGVASVTETFLYNDPPINSDKLVVYDFGGGDDKLADSIVFAQTYKTLSVQKDIILHATGDLSAVTVSFVDQTFSQVPEPSSLALIAVGMLAVGYFRKRS